MHKDLLQWCTDALQCKENDLRISPLSGDAGFRQYFRLHLNDLSYIAVFAPKEHINNPVFVDIAQKISMTGVIVPSVIAKDFELGFLLISDLGDDLLLKLLNEKTVDKYYKAALNTILSLQHTDTTGLPTYDRNILYREMALFKEWFVPQLLDTTIDQHADQIIEDCFKTLIESAIQQPRAFVHRDYHSRNILLFNNEIAVIDFQDALLGPVTYDAVSLLKDCYIKWPFERVEMWLKQFHDALIEHGIIEAETPFESTQRYFHLMGLQRHIKVLGIFARLSLRDGKHNYLHDLPMVIDYTLETLRRYASQYQSLERFLMWFELNLLPAINKQSWSKGRG